MGYNQFQSNEIEAIPIAKERTFLLIPKTLLSETEPRLSEEEIKARSKGADLKDFENYPFLFRKKGCYSRKMADSMFEEYEITPNIIYEDDDNDILFNLCLSGIGYKKGYDLRPCDKTFVEDFIDVHKKYSRFEDLF